MNRSIKIIILGLLLAITAIGIYWWQRGDALLVQPPSKDSAEFTDKIQNFVLQNIGQPIEGFDAEMYLRAFPGLTKEDFSGVETSEGEYVYSGGELNFMPKSTTHRSSAERAVRERGHETLLRNLRERLGGGLSVDEIIGKMTAQGLGIARGTIFRGPMCPVVKDPPEEECADQPVFGTFIVKDIAGVREIARFSTQRDGSFSVELPAGEYGVEPETSIGIGVQAYRIEVRVGETSEYTIIFDTGIR